MRMEGHFYAYFTLVTSLSIRTIIIFNATFISMQNNQSKNCFNSNSKIILFAADPLYDIGCIKKIIASRLSAVAMVYPIRNHLKSILGRTKNAAKEIRI